jgi:foldase protein PrsA
MDYKKEYKKAVKYISKNQLKSSLITTGVVLLLLLAFPLRFLVVPATVNGQPIFSWNYLSKLHQTSGNQVLDQLISEKLVQQEVKNQGIQVTQAEIDSQIAEIESQFGTESGGLESVLALQGLTRDEFIKQLRLNLSLEKLVKGNIQVTDEEISAELAGNASLYQELSELDAATSAAEAIRSTKLQGEFQTWFQGVKASAIIKNYFSPATPQFPAN